MAGLESAVFVGVSVACGAVVAAGLVVAADSPDPVAAASGGGTITACVAKKGGVMRVVSAARKCAKRERVITFSQVGPQGEAGSPGLAGAPGAEGPAGRTGSPGAVGTSAVYEDSTAGDVKPQTGSPPDYAMSVAQVSLPKGSYALQGRLHFQLAAGNPGTCALMNLSAGGLLATVSVPVTGNVVVLGATTVTSDAGETVQLRCVFPGTTSYAKDPALQAIKVDTVVQQ